ncbi:MAG: membrane protein insertion efficiency factor YidD [Nanoarchaeota archaeon]|nr:membrane protein insertion efficiency factor YidD [Nanoarchaeota archaeon]
MKREPNLLEKVSIYLIVNLHQKKISPYLNKKGGKCRFYPSCSNYGLRSIEKYGFFKGWKNWIKVFRDIRNRMTHHQIIRFSSHLSQQLPARQVIYTKHCISVIDKNGDEKLRPLPKYFEEVIKNYDKFRSKFYEKLNSAI